MCSAFYGKRMDAQAHVQQQQRKSTSWGWQMSYILIIWIQLHWQTPNIHDFHILQSILRRAKRGL
jgi:hypothetical protein